VEKQQIYQAVQKPAASDSRKNHLFAVAAACLLMGVSLAVSMALLGGSLGRFSDAETNVIPLIPPKSAAGGNTVYSATEPKETVSSPRTTGESAARQPDEYRGNLEIADGKQIWGSETQVDLFRNSYGDTVVSGDGEKVIAPGTSNFYRFTLKNNGNMPLDYTISLEVEPQGEEKKAAPAIPLEWRLLEGNGTAVSDWREYGSAERLKQSTLNSRRQDSYTIEWRWDFERSEPMDRTDTELGDWSARLPLGVKATITVHAEQSDDLEKPKPSGSDGWWVPKTGDPFRMTLYLAVLAVSACGLLILIPAVRRKKSGKTNSAFQ